MHMQNECFNDFFAIKISGFFLFIGVLFYRQTFR